LVTAVDPDAGILEAEVGDPVHLSPGGQMAEERAVRMCRRYASMRADLLEVDRADAASGFVDLLEPRPEAEEDHAAALESAGLEQGGAAGDGAVRVTDRPSGLLAEVERQDGVSDRVTGSQRHHWHRDSTCLTAHGAQSRCSHDCSLMSDRRQDGGGVLPSTSPPSASQVRRAHRHSTKSTAPGFHHAGQVEIVNSKP
jgi:hypothetical protein